jgi:predicted transcriptional regulator
MQANPSPRPERDDESVQRAVLSLVLDAHPKSLTIPQLAREIDRGDAVERAVRDLVGVGLLKSRGNSVEPTPAALYFDALDQS